MPWLKYGLVLEYFSLVLLNIVNIVGLALDMLCSGDMPFISLSFAGMHHFVGLKTLPLYLLNSWDLQHMLVQHLFMNDEEVRRRHLHVTAQFVPQIFLYRLHLLPNPVLVLGLVLLHVLQEVVLALLINILHRLPPTSGRASSTTSSSANKSYCTPVSPFPSSQSIRIERFRPRAGALIQGLLAVIVTSRGLTVFPRRTSPTAATALRGPF